MVGIGRKHPVSGSGRDEIGDVDNEDELDEEAKEKAGVEVDKQSGEGTKENDDAEQSNEIDENDET